MKFLSFAVRIFALPYLQKICKPPTLHSLLHDLWQIPSWLYPQAASWVCCLADRAVKLICHVSLSRSFSLPVFLSVIHFSYCSIDFRWFMAMHQWFILRNTTNKCICSYVYFLYYKQCSLLHVSAFYCHHRQGGVLWRICYTEHQNNLIYTYKMLSFK